MHVNKLAILTLLTLLLAGFASGEVFYEVKADDEEMKVNATVTLECDSNCPDLNWNIPQGAEVLSAQDGFGALEYDKSGDEVSLKPNRRRIENVTFDIRLLVDREAEEIYDGLYKREVSLAGFSDTKTSGIVENENLLSGKAGFGFQTGFSEDEMRFRGQGPVYLRFKYGEGKETDYFSFFGDFDEEAKQAYQIPVGTTGVYQEFERFPVAVMPDGVYNETVNRWSSGEYISGSMTIRDSLEEDFEPVLAHEVVHGLNDRELKWDSTRSSYIDEGIAEHVESLVKRKQGERTRNLFGEEITYRKKVDGDVYRYTLPSKGAEERLWSYYSEGREFMKSWNAINSRKENRRFGYAYSELIIKNYIANMNGSVKEIYEDLEINSEVSDPEEKWSIYSSIFDMTPCKYESRQRFKECLDSVNNHEYPVYSGVPQRGESVLQIEKKKVPNRTEFDQGNLGIRNVGYSFQDFMSQLIDYLSETFRGLTTSS